MNSFTPAQETAFRAMQDLMREHFDAGVLIVACDVADDDHSEVTESTYHGGFSRAVGLCELIRFRMVKRELGQPPAAS